MKKSGLETAKMAIDNNIPFLYHYQPYSRDYLEKLLSEKTIHCSNPQYFNDPWDCKPSFDSSLLKDPDELQKAREYLINKIQLNPTINIDLLNELSEGGTGSRVQIEKIITSVYEARPETLAKGFRIYCLTPDSTNSLMWAHYADKHKGICLEFDSTTRLFGGAWQVKYNNIYPEYRFYENSDPMFELIHKSDIWEYENEYRIVSREPTGNPDFDDSPLGSIQGILKLPENSLTSIIVGCDAPYREISDVVRALAPDVKIKRAVRIPHRYSIEIE